MTKRELELKQAIEDRVAQGARIDQEVGHLLLTHQKTTDQFQAVSALLMQNNVHVTHGN